MPGAPSYAAIVVGFFTLQLSYTMEGVARQLLLLQGYSEDGDHNDFFALLDVCRKTTQESHVTYVGARSTITLRHAPAAFSNNALNVS